MDHKISQLHTNMMGQENGADLILENKKLAVPLLSVKIKDKYVNHRF